MPRYRIVYEDGFRGDSWLWCDLLHTLRCVLRTVRSLERTGHHEVAAGCRPIRVERVA